MSAALRPHQRSVFVQPMVVNTEAHSWLIQRRSFSRVLSDKWDIHRTPLPKAEGPTQERRWKDYKSLRFGRSRVKQCLLNTARQLHSWAYSPCG